MTKSKRNANQQNQRQQTMDDKNPASASSSLTPKKDNISLNVLKKDRPLLLLQKISQPLRSLISLIFVLLMALNCLCLPALLIQLFFLRTLLLLLKKKEKLVKNCKKIFM